MPILRTPDETIDAYKLLLVDYLNTSTGAAWKINHLADKWNLLLMFDFYTDDPGYTTVSKQLCSSDFGGGIDEVCNEVIAWSRNRAIALKEIGVKPGSSIW